MSLMLIATATAPAVTSSGSIRPALFYMFSMIGILIWCIYISTKENKEMKAISAWMQEKRRHEQISLNTQKRKNTENMKVLRELTRPERLKEAEAKFQASLEYDAKQRFNWFN